MNVCVQSVGAQQARFFALVKFVKVVRGTPCALLDAALATIRDKGERHLRDHEEVIQLHNLMDWLV